jgi:integrase
MELALTLAAATGRRLSSIRNLDWSDIDLGRGKIRWRAEFEKTTTGSFVPIPDGLIEELKRLRREIQAVGGLVFPADRDPLKPMDRFLWDKWLLIAEREAQLPKLEGGLWHPYRRMWATARKGLPPKDVAAAGGWADIETLLKCYQQADEETVKQVMSFGSDELLAPSTGTSG